MKLRRALVSICFVLLGGCAATGPIFQNAPEPKESDALIYIYRPNAFGYGGRDAYFYVEDVNVVDLSNEGYTWFHLPAGEYTLKQKWPFDVSFGGKTIELKVNLKPNQKYYYRLNTTAGVGYNSVIVSWQFSEVPPEQAIPEISACKLQPPTGMQKLFAQLKR